MAKRNRWWEFKRSTQPVQETPNKGKSIWDRDYDFQNKKTGKIYVANEKAILNSNVYTVVSIVAGDYAKLPTQVINKVTRKKDTTHPLSYLLSTRPNPLMSAYNYKELQVTHLLTWGNFYANIEWDINGTVKALWPLDPSKTDVYIDYNAQELWYITTLPTGEMRKIHQSDTVHYRLISTTGLKGITPIEVIREKLATQQAMDEFSTSFYEKGTTTSGLLKSDKELQSGAKAKLREEWSRINSGLDNAHRVAVLDSGLSFQNIQMPLKDAEFIATHKFGISEVAKIYKVPPHKLGQLDRATFSNIEQQSLDYYMSALQPLITNVEQEDQYKLLSRNGRLDKDLYIKVNVNSLLRADSETRGKYYKVMKEIGVFSINDILDLEDMPGIGEAGDYHDSSLNFTTAEQKHLEYLGLLKGGEEDGEGDSDSDQQSGDSSSE